MLIKNVSHRGLRRFVEVGDESGLDPTFVERIRNILSFLQDMDHPRELHAVKHWRTHMLTGNRQGTWSISVSRNWRITFMVNEVNEIVRLNLEDYH